MLGYERKVHIRVPCVYRIFRDGTADITHNHLLAFGNAALRHYNDKLVMAETTTATTAAGKLSTVLRVLCPRRLLIESLLGKDTDETTSIEC